MALLQDVQHLLDRLDRPGSIGEVRAVLATAISKLYLLPVAKVLSLKAADVASDGDSVTLWPKTTSVQLSPRLSDVFRRRVSWQGSYLFPGRNGAQPLSRDAVRHHFAGCGNRRGADITGAEQARDRPTRVLTLDLPHCARCAG